MVINSKSGDLYAYFKALDTRDKENPEEKRTGISGWIDLLKKYTPSGRASSLVKPKPEK